MYPKLNHMKLSIEEVKEKIYDHIQIEFNMGLPPHESWEGITEIHDWVEECIESGYTIDQLKNELFDEVYEKWSNENE